MFLLIVYVCCSAIGLTLIKLGVGKGLTCGIESGLFHLDIGAISIVGLALYIISFLLSMIVMSKMELTYFYPLSAGLVYIIVCLLGVFLLHEKVSLSKIIGMAIIFLGVIVMNVQK